jgi:hypothetical protein
MAYRMAVYRPGDLFPLRELDCAGDSRRDALDDFAGLVQTLQGREAARLLQTGQTVAEYPG